MENVNPFELFKEELDNDDLACRVNTVHKLPIVATLMPVDAVKTTLLPYLDGMCKKEDDEVVFAIAQEYSNLAYMRSHLVPYSATSILSSSPTSKIFVPMTRQWCGSGQ